MFSIGFFELLLIAIVVLMVVGPEKLPETIRTISIQLARLKRFWTEAKRDMEREMGMDDIRREIHNAEVMETLERVRKPKLRDLTDEDIDGSDLAPSKNTIEPDAESAKPQSDQPTNDDVRRKEPDAD